jgi:Xaa-Pro aminopeptidase
MEENPVVLEVGMVQSNEPAIYVPGKYGIRIENMIACVESFKSEQGEFLEFETLTLVPIDLRLADLSKLCKSEIQWLKAYHSRVYDRLSVYLDDSEKRWLLSKTSSLD